MIAEASSPYFLIVPIILYFCWECKPCWPSPTAILHNNVIPKQLLQLVSTQHDTLSHLSYPFFGTLWILVTWKQKKKLNPHQILPLLKCPEDIASLASPSGTCPFSGSLFILKGVRILPLPFCKQIFFLCEADAISSVILSPNNLYFPFLGSGSSPGMSIGL